MKDEIAKYIVAGLFVLMLTVASIVVIVNLGILTFNVILG
jgi:hypothetical protein